ncbi:polysaccharide deacetylase family protein [Pseudarthrobacter sp. ATCC 49987]|uniref:polysaccharide deacetylase family protein n=1 Tax=Pseudarthrobacter sp. ATCC 49987 TaxID=2698204 RepID=UPI00136BD8E6|nr:polysaccharide deacetylase family protein [Pseudarthrobacter sp. ATCC 49987]
MWSILSGRSRLLAAAAAVLLLAAAVVLAVVLTAVPPSAVPTPPPPPSSSLPTTAGPTESPTAGPLPSGAPAPTPSGTVPAGPAPLPTIPATEPAPEPPLPEPPAPFPAALAGRDLEVIPGAGPVVALTFDAGANSAGLPSILQTLAATGVRGTFFLTGNWAGANPQGVAAIVAGGHRVGNHSMTHPGFTGLADAAIGDQLVRAQQAIQAGGGDPRPLFRFPFGDRDARTIATVNAYGYLPVRWAVDTLGWKGSSGGITAQIVADRALARLQPGEIVLMHIGSNPDDGTTLDADALPGMIERMRQAGYGFTTLGALLG